MKLIWWIGLPLRLIVAAGGFLPYSMLCGRWRTDLFWDIVLPPPVFSTIESATVDFVAEEMPKLFDADNTLYEKFKKVG